MSFGQVVMTIVAIAAVVIFVSGLIAKRRSDRHPLAGGGSGSYYDGGIASFGAASGGGFGSSDGGCAGGDGGAGACGA